MPVDSAVLVRTRQSLHGVAELLLAGPQFRTSGTIRLWVTPGGFATTAEPELRVEDGTLVTRGGRQRLAGRSFAEVAEAIDVLPQAPGNYHDGSGAEPTSVIEIDPAAATLVVDAFALGDEALRTYAPDETPVLWPEHFDLGITVGEVNFGVSPGDTYLAEPYAYVGPWHPRTGEFWNAPFGAARPLRELSDVDSLVAFLREGHERSVSEPPTG